jgi:hypothetical protein
MMKKLSAIGNSLGIVIEKPILELLDIDRLGWFLGHVVTGCRSQNRRAS